MLAISSRRVRNIFIPLVLIFTLINGATISRPQSANASPSASQSVFLPIVVQNYEPRITLGIDTNLADNSVSGFGEVNTCAAIFDIGDTINVDVYVDKITDLDAFQIRIGYDPEVIKVTGVFTDFLLFQNPGSIPATTIDPLPDTDGVLSIQAADNSPGDGEGGSGVLARILFEAVGEGASELSLIKSAAAPGTPALFDTNGVAIGDDTGDEIFDHDLYFGRIEIGEECTLMPNLLFVGFQEGTSEATKLDIIEQRGLRIVNQPEDNVYLLRIVGGVSSEEAALSFLLDENVAYTEPVSVGENEDHQTHPNDPEYNSPRAHQWDNINVGQPVNNQQGLIDADTDSPQAWDMLTDCRGPDPVDNPIVIAVLDTGVEVANPDLAANIWNNPHEGTADDVLPAVVDTNGAYFDGQANGVVAISNAITDTIGHGSAVASVIGAVGSNGRELAGQCWTATILVLKTDFTSHSIVRALRYVLDLKAAGVDIRLVNASYGRDVLSHTERNMIAQLGANDILFVAASGNQSRAAAAPREGIYRDNDVDDTVSNNDTRLTDVVSNGTHYTAGSTVNCPGDQDCGDGLATFDNDETYHDEGGNGSFDQGDPIYRDMDGDGTVSGGFDPTNTESGAGAGSCTDGNDNDLDGFIDGLDPDCHDGDRRWTMVSATHGAFGDVQYAAGSTVRCYTGIIAGFSDTDCGDVLSNFAANVKYADSNASSRIAAQFARYPCAYDLDNIICVGNTNNQDGIRASSNTGSPMVDLFAPGTDIRVLDVIGGRGSEMYRDADVSNVVSAADTRIVQVRSGAQSHAAGSIVAGGDNDVGSPLRVYPADVKHIEFIPANGRYDNGERIVRDNDGDDAISAGDERLNRSPRLVQAGHGDVGLLLAPFNVNEGYNSTRFIVGTSFSAPNTTGVAALCWSLMPDRPSNEIKDLILRFVDRKPGFAGHSVSGGRLRWPCGYDLGDAPTSYMTVSKEASNPELLECAGGDNGPIHLDYGLELFGVDASQEHNANTPDPLDMDLKSNLGPGPAGTCPTYDPDSDDLDNGGFTFIEPPPWAVGQVVEVTFEVCSDVISGTVQFNDTDGGRYDSGNADKRVYVTAWFDWNFDGTFVGEYTPLFPQEEIIEIELPAAADPIVPPPLGCRDVSRTFTAENIYAPWYRFRLDYGEHTGENDPNPLFEEDPKMPVNDETQIAIYGEVEDYPMFTPPPVKVSYPSIFTPGDFLIYEITMPANQTLTQISEAWIYDYLPPEVEYSFTDPVVCTVGECGYDQGEHMVYWNGPISPGEFVELLIPVSLPPYYPPECPPITNHSQGYDGVLEVNMDITTPVVCTAR